MRPISPLPPPASVQAQLELALLGTQLLTCYPLHAAVLPIIFVAQKGTNRFCGDNLYHIFFLAKDFFHKQVKPLEIVFDVEAAHDKDMVSENPVSMSVVSLNCDKTRKHCSSGSWAREFIPQYRRSSIRPAGVVRGEMYKKE